MGRRPIQESSQNEGPSKIVGEVGLKLFLDVHKGYLNLRGSNKKS